MAKSKRQVKRNSKPSIKGAIKPSRVRASRRNVHVQIAIERQGAGAGFHSSRKFNRNVKHRNQVEY